MKAIYSSETSVDFQRTTRLYIQTTELFITTDWEPQILQTIFPYALIYVYAVA
jgi:hypothetical protein